MKTSPPSIRNYFIAYNILWLIWMGLHILILNNNGISIHSALTDSLISNILLLVFCILLSNILRYYQPGKNSSKYLLVWCLALSSIWFLITSKTIPFILEYDPDFISIFEASLLLRFILANLLIGGSILLMWVWQNHKNQFEENIRHLQALQLVKDAELSRLRQQLQPHFLFNSLNSISSLAGSKPEQARVMIQQLADFLRGTLRKDESVNVPLHEEISNVKLYLEIEKVRFGHRLDTKITIPDDCLNMVIPPLMLQPIVENAIKFGLYDTLDTVQISIQAESIDNKLHIEVNNPCNNDMPASNGTGFGLSSIRRRLFLLYNRSDLLKTSKENSMFTCKIIIPQNA
jgi:two-component system LytT family sensor kinase